MKKLVLTIYFLVGLFSSPVSARVDLLSDETMENWGNLIIYSVIDSMDFLAGTKPVDMEKHLSTLKYIVDAPMIDRTDIEKILEEVSPKQTYEQMGGDCEDLTIYTIARFFQNKNYDVGFMLLRNPKTEEDNTQHIAAVVITDTDEIIVYDLTQEESFKHMSLEKYLKWFSFILPDFDAYRIHWFFASVFMQPKEEKIKKEIKK